MVHSICYKNPFYEKVFVSNSKPSKAAAAQVDCLACSTNRNEFTLEEIRALRTA